MPLSWNEIRHNAIRFARDWAGAKSERAEKQTFWNEFFAVFGIPRRVVAILRGAGQELSRQLRLHRPLLARNAAGRTQEPRPGPWARPSRRPIRYIHDLVSAGRQDEMPRYVIVSDFARISLHDLEPEDPEKQAIRRRRTASNSRSPSCTAISTISPSFRATSNTASRTRTRSTSEAVRIMDDLHDALKAGGYSGHDLERFLVRILFCLFAAMTGHFRAERVSLYIEDRTKPDGSDLGLHLARLFDVLNTPAEKRQKNLDETLAAFPYVNGELFAEKLGFADFNRDMRNSLLACTRFDWSRISPAIFGSLFQGVMEPRERRQIGGHYTSERDILKVIRPLFLDDLRAEFDRIKDNKNQLKQFHQKLAGLRFLDPACGCGNFLVIAYRELRLLEIDVLTALHGGQRQLDIRNLSLVDVDAFYGIEISEWPARIAEVAMWLMDHQMNVRLSEQFGQYFVRLPLRKSPTIVFGNALRLDWKEILPPEQCSYVLAIRRSWENSSPPPNRRPTWTWSGAGERRRAFSTTSPAGISRRPNTSTARKIVVGFVSTNSISQGEQVGILWKELFHAIRPEDSLRPSHVCLGERGPRQSPCPRRHHRLRRLRRRQTSASTTTTSDGEKVTVSEREEHQPVSRRRQRHRDPFPRRAHLRRAGDRFREHAERRRPSAS